MNEAYISGRIKAELKKAFPQAVIFKHNDRTSGGVPDLSITFGRRTSWFEVKYIKHDETPSRSRRHFDRVQLDRALRMNAHYIIAYHVNNLKDIRIALISPDAVSAFLNNDSSVHYLLLKHAIVSGYFQITMGKVAERLREERICAD